MSKVRDVLKYQDGGISVEEARKQMLAANEAPTGLTPVTTIAATDVLEPEFEPEAPATAAVPVEQPVIVASPAVIEVPAPPKIERIETSQFIGEIKQESGQWVAEIRYKKGSGTERFIAGTKNELMLKLLEGKGHATMRVHKAVRREKLGWSELDRQYPLPEGMTVEDFQAMSDKAQDVVLSSIARDQIMLFRDAHPEYLKTPENGKAMDDFLKEHKLPITLRNLEYAFEDLIESGILEMRPETIETPVVTSLPAPAPTPEPVRTDSVPAAVAPAPAPAAAPVAAAPSVVVRKRGTTGLQPGQSSSPTETTVTEDGGSPRQLSEAELRKLPLPELKRIANADRRMRSGVTR